MKIPNVAMPLDLQHIANTTLDRQAAETATGIEALFLRTLLGQIHKTAGGYAKTAFHDMLNEALADAMAEAGGIGLGALLEEQLAEAKK